MNTLLRLLIVAMDDDATAEYASLVRHLGADCFIAHAPNEIAAILRSAPLHGVVLDMPTAVRIKGPDKQWVFKLLELYPLIRLRYSRKNDAITAIGAEQDARIALESFLKGPCASFTPRTIRRTERKTLHFNVILWRENDVEGELAVVDNFTPLGCFVITPTPMPPGERVVLVFPGADTSGDHLQVAARVIHHVPWGSKRSLPGAGLAFEPDDDGIHEALERLFHS